MGRITLVGIEKSFGKVEVLKGIDLAIEDGELVVFVGPSGCGKSTLLRLIAGLDQPTRGHIAIDGRDVTQVSAAERGLAMVFQSYALYPHMTVRQNMAFGLENQHLPKPEIEARIAEAARMLEIGDYLARRPGQLSGGQRQRVAIGRAIVRQPTAFLLDEPLSNLDAELRVSMRAELAALHARLKTTMIYVTHDQIEAMTLADRIVVLRKGRIEQVDTPLNLYNKPANIFVAGFIGAPNMNILSGAVCEMRSDGFGVDCLGGRVVTIRADRDAARIGDKVFIGMRPHHLTPAAEGDIPARIELVEALGAETVLHARAASGERLLSVLTGQQRLDAGAQLRFRCAPQDVHAFDAAGTRLKGN